MTYSQATGRADGLPKRHVAHMGGNLFLSWSCARKNIETL